MGTSSSKRANSRPGGGKSKPKPTPKSKPKKPSAASAGASARKSIAKRVSPFKRSAGGGLPGPGWADQDEELAALEHAIFASNGVPRPGSAAYGFEYESEASSSPIIASNASRVLRGQGVAANDVAPRKTTVRIFVSSTFTDTNAERNAFLAFCAPHLREVCRARDLELVVSEMRWGVTEAMSNSHQTADLCQREVERCLSESAATQFVGILANKYGFQPLPTRVAVAEFEGLLSAVADEAQRTLLRTWYVLDENTVPSTYALLPVSAVIAGYNASVNDEASQQWWGENFTPLQRTFQQHSDMATRSVTEDEMLSGVQDPEQCLLIVRDFDTDVSDRNYADDHKDALARLRKEMVARVEPAGNVLRYDDVHWEEGGIDGLKHPQTHGKYLADVLSAWTRKVEASVASIAAPAEDALLEEAQAHWRFAQAKVGSFVGRSDLVQAVADVGVASKLVHGVSGAGKTSVLAMAAVELSASDSSTVVIPRFLGTTVASRTVRPLLESLCDQLWRAYKGGNGNGEGGGEERPDFPDQQYDLQVAFVKEYLALATAEQPLTLFLDSVDQVLDADALDWLPGASDLPPHVSLVVSVLTDDATLLQHAQRKAYADEVSVALLSMADVPAILSSWLEARGRALTAAQQAFVVATLESCASPTYLLLRVLFNEALEWSSFAPLEKTSTWGAITSIVTAVDVLLAKVEAEFGAVLTSTALALLTFSRDGLSDAELADLLSADNAVLAEVFEWWLPPQARVPPLLVTRLLDTLRDYFVSAGTNKWFHRQFWQTAQARYSSRKLAALTAIAAYFGGSTELTPLDMPRFKQRLGRNRQLPEQPFKLSATQHNVRKLRELPEALLATGQTDAAVALLADVRFVIGMFSVGLHDEVTYDLLRDARLPTEGAMTELLADLQQVLELGRTVLLGDPLELVSQLYGRLEAGHALLKDVDAGDTPGDPPGNASGNTPAAWQVGAGGWSKPAFPSLTPARSPLRKTLRGHGGPVMGVAYLHELDLVVSCSGDSTLKAWKASTGQLVRTLEGHREGVNCVAVSAELDVVVSGSSDMTVKTWRASTGALLLTLEGHEDVVAGVAVSAELGIVVSGSWDCKIKIWEASTGLLLRTLPGHNDAVLSVAVDAGLDMVVSGGDDAKVRVWRASTGEELRMLKGHRRNVESVVVAGELDLIASGGKDGSVLMWEASTGVLLRSLEGHDEPVDCLALAAGLDLLVSGSEDKKIKTWRASTGELLQTLEGHAEYVVSLAVAEEVGMVISGGWEEAVLMWTNTSEVFRIQERHARAVWCVAVAAAADLVVTGADDDQVKLWRASTGELRHTLVGHTASVYSVAVAAELDMVASASGDKSVRLWRASTGALLHTLDHPEWVDCVALSADLGIVVTGARDDTVRVFQASTGDLQHTLVGHSASVDCVEVAAGLDMVVSGDGDGSVRLWQASTGALLRTLEGHAKEVHSVAVAAELDLLVTGSKDCSVKVYRASSGTLLRTLEGHKAWVTGVAVAPELGLISSTDYNGNSLLWDIASGEQVTRAGDHAGQGSLVLRDGPFRVRLANCAVAFSTDASVSDVATQGGIVAVGDNGGGVHIFRSVID